MSSCRWQQFLVCIQKRSFTHICSCLFMHKVHCSCSSCNYNSIFLCHTGPIQYGFITLWPSNGHLEVLLVVIQIICPKNSALLLFKINFNRISDLIEAKKILINPYESEGTVLNGFEKCENLDWGYLKAQFFHLCLAHPTWAQCNFCWFVL